LYFLVSHIIALIYSKSISLCSNKVERLLIYVLLIMWLAFLPSLQFGVGTDYFSYISIVENPEELSKYSYKGEYFFYYLVYFLTSIGFPSQSLFFFTSLLMSVLIVNFFRKLGGGKDLAVLIFTFLFITGMYHNQLNGIRTYISVYLFVNALLYRFEGRNKISVSLYLMGVLWHQTIIPFAIFLLIPASLYKSLSEKMLPLYIISTSLFILGVPFYFIEFIVSVFLPFYSHYLEMEMSGASLLNILSKMYYMPVHFIFIYIYLRNKVNILGKYESVLVFFWSISANFYFLFLYWDNFFRGYHYFAIFSIVPFYYLIKYFFGKRRKAEVLILALYALTPYVFKVIVVPVGEYSYMSIIHQAIQ